MLTYAYAVSALVAPPAHIAYVSMLTYADVCYCMLTYAVSARFLLPQVLATIANSLSRASVRDVPVLRALALSVRACRYTIYVCPHTPIQPQQSVGS